MQDVLAKVTEFHNKFKLPVGEWGKDEDPSRPHLRFDLINEELIELNEALFDSAGDLLLVPDRVAALDALADLIYVVAGAAVEWGLPLKEAFDEVHRSNMTKEGGGYRADGKVMKGPNYSPPDIAGVLARHDSRASNKSYILGVGIKHQIKEKAPTPAKESGPIPPWWDRNDRNDKYSDWGGKH